MRSLNSFPQIPPPKSPAQDINSMKLLRCRRPQVQATKIFPLQPPLRPQQPSPSSRSISPLLTWKAPMPPLPLLSLFFLPIPPIPNLPLLPPTFPRSTSTSPPTCKRQDLLHPHLCIPLAIILQTQWNRLGAPTVEAQPRVLILLNR